MKFLVDNQLPIALSRFLETQQMQSCHVVDIQMDKASDREIWEYAKLHHYVIISKDADFVQFAHLMPDEAPAIVWVRLGNCRKTVLIDAFEKILPDLIVHLTTQKIVEVW